MQDLNLGASSVAPPTSHSVSAVRPTGPVAPVPSAAFQPHEVAAFQQKLQEAMAGRLSASAQGVEQPGRMSQYLTQMEKTMSDLNQERLQNVEAFPTLSMQEITLRNIDMATRTAAVNINFQVAGSVTKSLRGSVQQLLKGQ